MHSCLHPCITIYLWLATSVETVHFEGKVSPGAKHYPGHWGMRGKLTQTSLMHSCSCPHSTRSRKRAR